MYVCYYESVLFFFFSSRRRHTRCALVTGVQTCALPILLQRHKQARAAEPNAPVRIGYLAVTDSTPLLVAHHNKLFEAQGLEVEKPRLFRSWAQIVEAFLAGQVNVVHLLSPMTVWARYGSQSRDRKSTRLNSSH